MSRLNRRLTLGQVAEKVGVSVSALSQLERDQFNPTIATLKAIATTLDTTIGSLVAETSPLDRAVVRAGERKRLSPTAVIERLEAAPDQLEACLDLAYEQAAHAMSLPGVAGLHFISFRKDAGIAKTCRRLGIPTYAERVEHGYGSPVAV